MHQALVILLNTMRNDNRNKNKSLLLLGEVGYIDQMKSYCPIINE